MGTLKWAFNYRRQILSFFFFWRLKPHTNNLVACSDKQYKKIKSSFSILQLTSPDRITMHVTAAPVLFSRLHCSQPKWGKSKVKVLVSLQYSCRWWMVVLVWRSWKKKPTISVIETDRGCLFLIITDVGINERHFKVEQLQFEMQKLHNISSCLHWSAIHGKKKRALMHRWNRIIPLNNSSRYSHYLKSLYSVAEGKWELESLVQIDKSHQTPEGSPNFPTNHSTPWAGGKQWRGINTCNWEKVGQETASKPHKWVTSPPDSK